MEDQQVLGEKAIINKTVSPAQQQAAWEKHGFRSCPAPMDMGVAVKSIPYFFLKCIKLFLNIKFQSPTQ